MNCISYDLNSFPKDFKRNEVVSKTRTRNVQRRARIDSALVGHSLRKEKKSLDVAKAGHGK